LVEGRLAFACYSRSTAPSMRWDQLRTEEPGRNRLLKITCDLTSSRQDSRHSFPSSGSVGLLLLDDRLACQVLTTEEAHDLPRPLVLESAVALA